MTAMDITGVIVLTYALVVCPIEIAMALAKEAADARRKADAQRERPSSLPAVRW